MLYSLPASFIFAESSGGISSLGLDPKLLILQIVSFVIVFWVLKRYAFGPIIKMLDERYQKIEGSISHAEELEETNKQAEANARKLLQEARKQAEEVINRGHEEAGAIINQAETQAGERAAKIIKDGENRIAGEVTKAQAELKKETLGLVAQATGILLEKKVDLQTNDKLIKQALEESK